MARPRPHIEAVVASLMFTVSTDFAKIALATDRVRPSRAPETWKIGGFVAMSVTVGVMMVAESLGLLYVAWSVRQSSIVELGDPPRWR